MERKSPLSRLGWLPALAAACLLATPVAAGDVPASLDPDALESARQRIREVVERGGPFDPIEGRWELIEEPDVALAWALHEEEPFSTQTLDAIEKIVLRGQGAGHRFVLAAFLYRYGRQLGRDLMISELRGGERATQAAVVLAMNQEPLAAGAIAEHFRATERPHKRLISALGSWVPVGTPLLAEGFSEDARHRDDYLRAFAEGDHQVGSEVVQDIERLTREGEPGTRARAAIALLRLRPDQRRSDRLGQLRSAIRSGDALFEADAVRALGAFGEASDRVIYRRLVLELLASPSEKGGAWASGAQLSAAELLGRDGSAEDFELVLRVLDLPGLQREQRERLAVSLVARREPFVDDAVERSMGDGFVARVLRLERLNSLPPEILPVPYRSLAETVVRSNQQTNGQANARRGGSAG